VCPDSSQETRLFQASRHHLSVFSEAEQAYESPSPNAFKVVNVSRCGVFVVDPVRWQSLTTQHWERGVSGGAAGGAVGCQGGFTSVKGVVTADERSNIRW